jgi:thiamine pyrophosphate-dependent acetolactate synthase large subunit-like protein
MAKAMGWHAETVTEPADVQPALRRALAANETKKPAFLEFVASQHPVHGGWVGR